MTALNNFQNIELETDISVITLDDNINHTNCSKIKWEKDNRTPVGTARLIMPYSEYIEEYWSKYSGAVVIHANLNSTSQLLTQAMLGNFPNSISLNMKKIQDIDKKKDTKTNKIHIKNDEYNYSFIGKVYRFKQVGKTYVVYLEDLGWKFLQKVPKEFRDSYISGQSLGDAFQAICEFMGVDFAYSIEDLNQYNFSADGYSVEKDGEIIEDVPSILKEWSNANEKTEDEQKGEALNNDASLETEGLIEYEKNTQQTDTNNNSSINSQVTNTQNQVNDNSLQENNNQKILEYQEEFDNKIKDLFIGNTLYDSNVSDSVLNYNAITITPKSTTTNTESTNINEVNDETNQEDNQSTNNEVTE